MYHASPLLHDADHIDREKEDEIEDEEDDMNEEQGETGHETEGVLAIMCQIGYAHVPV